eukprot:Plantae.Rhodophyta-Palmaria_palmata.ctg21756.p1 GENE.Plantae.Rhodophyta-Palmaria_palmata.ctg21756~~Plantae.Rhodophyta-Palmaria_palmata.ctg21756.p1  ORF type:complete len:142 (+),score=3.04 Plantae.Rhodophyta-Palmaria_palmata.ctg21756:155-580(+)
MVHCLVFELDGEYCQCLALPLGWGPLAAVFCQFLRPFVSHFRRELGYSLLWYLNDFLLSPQGDGSPESCLKVSRKIQARMDKLGRLRHATKDVWGSGTTRLEHLGFLIYTEQMKIQVTQKKQETMAMGAKPLVDKARKSKG